MKISKYNKFNNIGFHKFAFISSCFVFLFVIMLSVGYSVFTESLETNADVIVRSDEKVRFIDNKIKEFTNGGSEIEDKIYFIEDPEEETTHNIDVVPKKDGYKFDGWYLDKELTIKADTVKGNYDVELYAKWVKKTDNNKDQSNNNSEDVNNNINDSNNKDISPSPKTDDEIENPKTFDGIFVWIIVFIISITAIVIGIDYKRKKANEE